MCTKLVKRDKFILIGVYTFCVILRPTWYLIKYGHYYEVFDTIFFGFILFPILILVGKKVLKSKKSTKK